MQSVFATTLECEGDSSTCDPPVLGLSSSAIPSESCVDDIGDIVGVRGMNGLWVGTAYE